MFAEYIALAFRDFAGNKMRTLLSMLGIVIGVASVVIVTSFGTSATVSIQNDIASTGMESLTLAAGRDAEGIERYFTEELGDELEKFDGIRVAAPTDQTNANLRAGHEEYPGATVMGVTSAFTGIYNYELVDGRFLTADENERRRNVVVLGSEIAEVLFPDGDGVGQYIKIFRDDQAKSFKVIGIMEEKTATFGLSFDSSLYIPYETFIKRIKKLDYVVRFSIGTEKGADVLEIQEELETYMTELTGSDEMFRVMSPSTIAEMFTTVTQTIQSLLTAVAGISLLVGGIGIMNIMLVSVSERTKEIGIRKALGASPVTIRGQFLTEAVCLTLSGGAAGILIGTLLSFFALKSLGWSFAPNYSAYLVALLFSSGVGIFFGWYPAARASKLDPIMALSYE